MTIVPPQLFAKMRELGWVDEAGNFTPAYYAAEREAWQKTSNDSPALDDTVTE